MKYLLKTIRFILFHIIRLATPAILITLKIASAVAFVNFGVLYYTSTDVTMTMVTLITAGILASTAAYYFEEFLYFIEPH